MIISYNWLKEYLQFDLTPRETADALTDIGIEAEGVEEVQSIKGGLEGLVIGKVLTCTRHPNSDHLHLTTVDIGDGAEPLNIVCGAPNVAAGQKVVVAPIGTKLYDDDKVFTIKRTKIRGEESLGMICSEREIGTGTSHEGIIVLPDDARVGTHAKEYYNVQSNYRIEVDITPNRVDAASHFGVARDLAAYLKQAGKPFELKKPSVDTFAVDSEEGGIEVVVDNHTACPPLLGVDHPGGDGERESRLAEEPLDHHRAAPHQQRGGHHQLRAARDGTPAPRVRRGLHHGRRGGGAYAA
jgi:phenylalanyl-tRNA synthetase beta chain